MLLILIALVAAVAAIALALKVLRGSAPEQQVQRRLKMVQEEEFAPAEFESETDVRKEDRLSRVRWMNHVLVRLDVAARLRLLLEQADVDVDRGKPADSLLLQLDRHGLSAVSEVLVGDAGGGSGRGRDPAAVPVRSAPPRQALPALRRATAGGHRHAVQRVTRGAQPHDGDRLHRAGSPGSP